MSVSTKAYGGNASHVTCQAPPLTAFKVEDASVVRAKVFVLENGVDVPGLRHPLVRAFTSSSDGCPSRGRDPAAARQIDDGLERDRVVRGSSRGALDDAVCDFGDAGCGAGFLCVAGHPRVRGAFIRTEARAAHRRGVFGRLFRYTRS